MNFGARITTITQDTILNKAIDNVLGDNWITFRILSNGLRWTGHKIDRPIKVSKSDLGGSFSGLDTHSTATVDTRVLMSYDLRGYEMPVAIPGMEKSVNRTSAEVINLVRIEVESAQEDACDDLGTLFYADGTGNANKDFLGWDALIDDGTSVATIGGLTRASYTPNLDSVRTDSGGTLDMDKIATLIAGVSSGSSMSQRPTTFVSDETVWNLYESLLTPTQQANYQAYGLPVMTRASKAPIRQAELKGAGGFVALSFRGIPFLADEKSTSQTLWAVNENYIKWYGLSDPDLKSISLGSETIDSVYNDAPKNTGFQWTGFMRPINQYGEVAHIYLLGNQVCWHPRRQGRLTGITGV